MQHNDFERDGCEGACGGCEPKPVTLSIAGASSTTESDAGGQADALTRGLLGSFARFIETGAEPDRESVDGTGESSVARRGLPNDQNGHGCAERPEGAALDEALGRVEAAMAALVSAVPTLEGRITALESSGVAGGPPAGIDRDGVALGLKDRLAGVERECQRLASVPIERIETRVASAERSLGALVERAETAVARCAEQHEACERVAERLEALAGALDPWRELLDLRETEGGMPRPMSALLRVAGAELAREMLQMRGSLDRFAGVLEIPGVRPADEPDVNADSCQGPGPSVERAPGKGDVVAPHEPSEEGPRQRGKGKPKAVRAKGGDAEAPRRGASEARLSAAARLRARSRAEGRPPRR
jgi:hypothetical protein